MLAETLRLATVRLMAVSESPRLDAELLLAHALGISREQLLLGAAAAHGMEAPEGFEALLARRLNHEPMAYILGERAFWTLNLSVGPGVLIPRPDSETIVEAALVHFGKAGPVSILDLGTGSGALLLACLDHWRGATGLGIDRSEEALGYARINAVRHGLEDRVRFQPGNWCEGITETFDLILCNPPYVESAAALSPQVRDYEPASALFAGADGLDDYRVLIPQLPARLNPDGIAVLELGAGQAPAVAAMARAHGLDSDCRKDLAGHDRALVLFPCKDGAMG